MLFYYLYAQLLTVVQCKDLAVQTGCWVFLGAQHPNATSGPINYTSSRLRRDAPELTGELVTEWCDLVRALLLARRTDALEVGKRLVATQNEAAARAQEAEILKRELAARTAAEVEKDKELEQYRRLYGA